MIGQAAPPGDGGDIDHNLWDNEDPTGSENKAIRYLGDEKNFSEWQATNIGGVTPGANSLEEDYQTDNNFPDFTDNQTDGSGTYTLNPGSPARHGGISLSGYQSKLRPEATFGSSGTAGTTMNDILSIGAYGVYRGSAGM